MMRRIPSKIRSLLISRKIRFSAVVILLLYLIHIHILGPIKSIKKRREEMRYIEHARKESKNHSLTFCEIPNLDPHDPEVTQYDVKTLKTITCSGFDWVRCHLNRCQARKEITSKYKNVECTYRDIIHVHDAHYYLGENKTVLNGGVYMLNNSDHAKVTCVSNDLIGPANWTSQAIGFRPTRPPTTAAIDKLNIMMFGFVSTSRTHFIRSMPKSYKVLKDLGAVIFEGYNVVGEGAPDALFPFIFGKSSLESELGNGTRKDSQYPKKTLDFLPNLFKILKEIGYRTCYFEDDPWGGAFQSNHTGFIKQPADHYLRSFFSEAYNKKDQKYCIGDTPQYLLLTNKTKEFWEQDGAKFSFTILADITHNDQNMIGAGDDKTADFLRWVNSSGLLENTLLFVFGAHGSRSSGAHKTFMGRLEQRLPLMSIILPRKLKRDRPNAVSSLARNAEVLTTPFDVHTTVLDAVGLKSTYNYTVQGARIPRGLSLLRPIPRNRTCWEAEVRPHWCTCVRWEKMPDTDPLYQRAADALVKKINDFIRPHKMCRTRVWKSTQYVVRRRANKDLMSLRHHQDPTEVWDAAIYSEHLRVKVTTQSPGGVGVYEASLIYRRPSNAFEVDWKSVNRTSAYGDGLDCVSHNNRKLRPFCFCNKF